MVPGIRPPYAEDGLHDFRPAGADQTIESDHFPAAYVEGNVLVHAAQRQIFHPQYFLAWLGCAFVEVTVQRAADHGLHDVVQADAARDLDHLLLGDGQRGNDILGTGRAAELVEHGLRVAV